ncbi:MAG: GTP-binding protein [Bacteroidetes bacterium]|jgi:small GTP-binding protein|nr:GTP-binding protein [Bacteroidota bacterium]MDF1863183.1 GTP-binding protein [Saprospiraceae bacterium]
MINKKVILTGSFGVGKTSLFNQFLYQRFSDKYMTTIGVKVDKKAMEIEGESLTMLIWDIAGEVSQDKVPSSYFLGASGIIYVCDLSRPITFNNIEKDLEYLRKMLPGVAIKLVGNKRDLVTQEQVQSLQENLANAFDILTSAKTGENVEHLFYEIGKELISNATT